MAGAEHSRNLARNPERLVASQGNHFRPKTAQWDTSGADSLVLYRDTLNRLTQHHPLLQPPKDVGVCNHQAILRAPVYCIFDACHKTPKATALPVVPDTLPTQKHHVLYHYIESLQPADRGTGGADGTFKDLGPPLLLAWLRLHFQF